MVVGDFGSGHGFFAIGSAKIVGDKGTVYAVDVQEEVLRHLMAEARVNSLRNITTYHCDLEKENACPVPPVSCDAVILANILHQVKERKAVVAASYRALKTGGFVLVVEWEPSVSILGPSAEARISEEEIAELFINSGFRPGRQIPTDPYHYAVTYSK